MWWGRTAIGLLGMLVDVRFYDLRNAVSSLFFLWDIYVHILRFHFSAEWLKYVPSGAMRKRAGVVPIQAEKRGKGINEIIWEIQVMP